MFAFVDLFSSPSSPLPLPPFPVSLLCVTVGVPAVKGEDSFPEFGLAVILLRLR